MFTLTPVTNILERLKNPRGASLINDELKLFDLEFTGTRGIQLKNVPLHYVKITNEDNDIRISYTLESREYGIYDADACCDHKCDIICKNNSLSISTSIDVTLCTITDTLTDEGVDSLRHCAKELQEMIDQIRLCAEASRVDSDSSDDMPRGLGPCFLSSDSD